jgi:hypothetical protein
METILTVNNRDIIISLVLGDITKLKVDAIMNDNLFSLGLAVLLLSLLFSSSYFLINMKSKFWFLFLFCIIFFAISGLFFVYYVLAFLLFCFYWTLYLRK